MNISQITTIRFGCEKNRCEKQPISFSIAVQKHDDTSGWVTPRHSFKNILTTTRKTFTFLADLENSFKLKAFRECKRSISFQHNVIF